MACQEGEHVIRLLDFSHFTELARLDVDRGDYVASLAFSEDGSRLFAATRDSRLHVWDLWRIRHGLRRIGLDWTDESLPTTSTSTQPSRPLSGTELETADQ